MKKLFSFALAIALAILTGISTYALDPANGLGKVTECYYDANGSKHVTVMNDEYVSTAIYNPLTGDYDVTLKKANQILIHNVGNVNEENGSSICLMGINENSDYLFNYYYYSNTSSAYGDMYWRLKDPNKTPTQKYFFAGNNSSNMDYAKKFADEVENMRTAEKKAITLSSVNAVSKVVAAVGNSVATTGHIPEAALIQAVAIAVDVVTTIVEPLHDAYTAMYNADMWYDFIDETIRP